MKPLATAASVALAACAGFGAGYLVKSQLSAKHMASRLEDQALQGTLHGLLVGDYVQRNDLANLKDTNDIWIHTYLRLLDENKGSLSSPEARESEVRTLNAIALYWERSPPFQGSTWLKRPGDWSEAFAEEQAKNMALLQWARSECQAHPEYECKQARP